MIEWLSGLQVKATCQWITSDAYVQHNPGRIFEMKVHLDNINQSILSESDDQWSHEAEFMGHYRIRCCASIYD